MRRRGRATSAHRRSLRGQLRGESAQSRATSGATRRWCRAVIQRRVPYCVRRRTFGKRAPKSGSRRSRACRERSTRVQAVHAAEGALQPGLIVVVEAFARDFLPVNMERLQSRECFPLVEPQRPFQAEKVPDFHGAVGRRGRDVQTRQLAGPHLFHLLVVLRGKQEKLLVLEAEPVAAFGDAAFAQNQALAAVRRARRRPRPNP